MGERKQREFAEWLGESPPRVNHYLNGNNDYPAADFLVKLAQKGVNINWLLTGDGEIYVKPAKPYPVPEAMQILVHELADAPGMVPKLTDIVRRAKDVKKADDEVKTAFEGLKQAIRKKTKRPHNPSE